MALSIEQLRSAFKTQESDGNFTPNNYYPFWNMEIGKSCRIRFLPDVNEENPLGFMVEKFNHRLEINGETKTVPCLKMYDGEDCPICNVSSAYYKDNDDDNGKKYWRKKSHIVQAIIIEDPLPADAETGETHEGKVRFMNLGFQIYGVIKESFESGELEDIPYLYENGCDFIIKKTHSGKYDSYAVGTKFARNSSDLTEDQIATAVEGSVDLSTLLPKHPTLEKVEAMLEAALTGEQYVDNSSNKSSDSDDSDDEPKTPAKKPAAKKPAAKKPADDEPEEEFDDEADAILAQIRQRRKAK